MFRHCLERMLPNHPLTYKQLARQAPWPIGVSVVNQARRDSDSVFA